MSRRHGLSDWEATLKVTDTELCHKPALPHDTPQRSNVRQPDNIRAKTRHL